MAERKADERGEQNVPVWQGFAERADRQEVEATEAEIRCRRKQKRCAEGQEWNAANRLDDLIQAVLLEDSIEKEDRKTNGGNQQSIPDYAFPAHRLSIPKRDTRIEKAEASF